MLSNIQRNIIIRALRIRKSQGEEPADILEGYKNLTEEEKAELLDDMQIPTDIMVALIGLLGSAAGAFVGVVTSAKLTNYRIEQLEKKVDKHNTVIERTYKLEETQAVIQEQIKVANHRIGDLEKEREE